MKNIEDLTNKRLKKLVKETKKSLLELEEELARRETEQQEFEIAHLEDHFQSAEGGLKTIRDFLSFLSHDMHKNKKD